MPLPLVSESSYKEPRPGVGSAVMVICLFIKSLACAFRCFLLEIQNIVSEKASLMLCCVAERSPFVHCFPASSARLATTKWVVIRFGSTTLPAADLFSSETCSNAPTSPLMAYTAWKYVPPADGTEVSGWHLSKIGLNRLRKVRFSFHVEFVPCVCLYLKGRDYTVPTRADRWLAGWCWWWLYDPTS
jgi:hypothetical protein